MLIVFFSSNTYSIYLFFCVCYTGTAVLTVKLKCYTLSMQVAGPLLER